MSSFIRSFLQDDSGAAAAEYVLILAVVGAGVGAGAYYLGQKISGALTARGDSITACTTDASKC